MAYEPTIIKKGVSSFSGFGKVGKLADFNFKIDAKNSRGDYKYNSMTLPLETKHGNIRVESMGGHFTDTSKSFIYAHGKKLDNNGREVDDFTSQIKIKYEDRNNPEVIKVCGDMCFFRATLELDDQGKGIEKKFLSEYDFIKYIKEHLTEGMVVGVRGNIEYNKYKDNLTTRKKITSIYLTDKKDEELEIKFKQTMITDNNTLGKPDKETMTAPLDVYVMENVQTFNDKEIIRMVNGKEKKGAVMPFMKTFDLKVVNIEATKKVAKHFKAKSGKLGTVIATGIFLTEGNAEVKTFNIEDLDQNAKDLLEAGLITREELERKFITSTGGNRKVEKMLVTGIDFKVVVTDGGGVDYTIEADPNVYDERDIEIENILTAQNAKFKEEIVEDNIPDGGDNPFDNSDDDSEMDDWDF